MMHRDERRSSTSKRSRETEAEAVAFVVCHAIGLETGSASQDYIQLYEGDAHRVYSRHETSSTVFPRSAKTIAI
jgi:hypothetical protein